VALRRSHPALRQRRFLLGKVEGGADSQWLRPDGHEMTDADWHDADRRTVGLRLDGVFVVLNAADVDVTFALPEGVWERRLDTAAPDAGALVVARGEPVRISSGSSVVFAVTA
jgi:glycogen operon protein